MFIDIRQAVINFAEAMECKLKTKDTEHGKTGWLDTSCNINHLLERLIEEVDEAKDALNDCNSEALSKECVDIANFAMMISDRIRYCSIKENKDG